jgi:hypothetical protein
MILISSVLLILITVTNPTGQLIGQTDFSNTFLTYRDPTFGYSIEYPSDWTISHIRNTTFISTPDRNEAVFISVNSSIDKNMTTKELGNKLVEVNSNSSYAKNFSLIDRNTNDYGLAGYPAARVEFTAKQFHPITGETQQRVVILASLINGKGYLVALSAPDTKFSYYTKQFGHMLYSFKINNNVN